MPSLIAIQVSLQVKEAFEHEIAVQTVEQNDAMIRIGLEAVRMLRNVHVNSDIDALKQTYERQLEWKDQEHEVFGTRMWFEKTAPSSNEKTKGPTTIKSDQFKTILKTLVSAEQLHIPKMDKSQITIVGYALL